MEQNYYLVEAMCGHVGRYNYIPIVFPVTAVNGKEAASLVRYFPRVKHDHKYAILNVRKVSLEEYEKQREVNANDKYLTWNRKNPYSTCQKCEIQERAKRLDEFIQEDLIEKVKRRKPRRKQMRFEKRLVNEAFWNNYMLA